MLVGEHQPERKFERGVTTLEGAVVLITFFVLLLGVIEAGRFLSMRQVLTNAAREGARFAVAPTSGTNTLPTQAEVTTKVTSFLASGHVTGATVTVRCPVGATDCSNNDAAMSVTTGPVTTEYTKVTVTKPYSVITIPGFFNALNITLKGESLMRRETSE